jgi:hypothetical protein
MHSTCLQSLLTTASACILRQNDTPVGKSISFEHPPCHLLSSSDTLAHVTS